MHQAANIGRLEKSWTSTPNTIDALIYQQWSILVARSRDQAENNDHAAKFLQLAETNIIGPTGFILKSQVEDRPGKPDTEAQKAIESAWYEFGEIGNFDVTGNLSRSDVEKLLVKQVATDGEVFIIKHVSPDFAHGIAVELVDACMVDPQHFERLASGNVIRHGIEFNQFSKPVAYWFANYDEHQIGYVQGIKPKKRILAENVIHIFLPEKIGQKRGLPWMRTALWRMKMLQGYEDATITGKRVRTALTGFFSDPDGDDIDDLPLEIGEPGQMLDIGNRTFQAPPANPDSGEYDPFVKSMLRSIGAGLKVPYNDLGNDLEGVSFSSIRQGALDAREMWKGLQEWLIGQWCKKLFNAWLPVALASQKITVPSRAGTLRPLSFEKLAKYRPIAFRGRRWAWIDPLAETKANELALNLGIRSRTSIIEDMGDDADETFATIQRENESMKACGLDPRLPGEKNAQTKPTQLEDKAKAN